ncbi:transposase [bacterium]|nr:transposase [bacterium]
MPRVPRTVVPGYPYHLTARGNERAQVFFLDDDCRQYLLWLADYSAKYGLKTWAYCLMANHVHLVTVPLTETGLSDVFGALQMRYARRINDRRGTTGHVWEGRFRACPVDERHLIAAVRYVERNPVRAGLVERAEDFAWSSARPHCGLRRDPVLAPDLPLLELVSDWRDWLRTEEDPGELGRLRHHTLRCQPCGSEGFVEQFRRRQPCTEERK